MNPHRTLIAPALALLTLLTALPMQAQPLIDQVPAEAALYVGWRGADDMGPAYQGSNLQGVLEQTGLLEALPQLVDAIQSIAEEEAGEEELELLRMGGELWSSMWSDGGALYMMTPEPNGPPIPRVALLWNKGKNEGRVREALSKLVGMINEQQPPDAPPMAFMGSVGDAVFMSIGFNAGQANARPLTASLQFQKAAKQVQADGALVVYLDVKAWIEQVDQIAKMMKDQADQRGRPADPFVQLWPTLRDATGLSGVNRLMLSAGIQGKNWHTRAYLDAPAPRTGVMALLEGKPIKPASLNHVPKSATYLQVFTLEPAQVLSVTRDIMGAVDQGLVRELDRGLADASEVVGFNFERELVNGMGPVWTVYIDPMVAGNGFSSMVLVNELRDPKAVEQALNKLADKANEAFEEGVDDGPMKLRLLSQDIDGTRVTHLGIPLVAPSWMVHKGRLYVALFPQALEMAIAQSGQREDSILNNPAFQQAMGRFLPGNVDPKPNMQFDNLGPLTGLSFTDLPKAAADGYGMNLMIVQLFAGFGEMMTGEASPMRMPPIGKVMPFIETAGAVSWADDDGLHLHAIEPFPGSALLGPAKGLESSLAVTAPVALGVALPALGAARQAAQGAEAAMQCRMITQAMFNYAADHKGKAPADIAELREYIGDASPFFSPQSTRVRQVPAGFRRWDKAEQDAYIRQNSSFIMVPVGDLFNQKRPNEVIVVFQRPDEGQGRGIVIGWGDGHITTERNMLFIEKKLKDQTGQTLDQLIAAQERAGQ